MGGEPVLLVVNDEGRPLATGETTQGVDSAQGMLIFVLDLLDHRIEQPERATMP